MKLVRATADKRRPRAQACPWVRSTKPFPSAESIHSRIWFIKFGQQSGSTASRWGNNITSSRVRKCSSSVLCSRTIFTKRLSPARVSTRLSTAISQVPFELTTSVRSIGSFFGEGNTGRIEPRARLRWRWNLWRPRRGGRCGGRDRLPRVHCGTGCVRGRGRSRLRVREDI